jgi:hypothetical protein
MGSLRSLVYNPLAKKNQPKKPKPSWRGLLARQLRYKIGKEYPEMLFEVKPHYVKTSSVYISWASQFSENGNIVNRIVEITSDFLAGKSLQKPVRVGFTAFNNRMVIQEIE